MRTGNYCTRLLLGVVLAAMLSGCPWWRQSQADKQCKSQTLIWDNTYRINDCSFRFQRDKAVALKTQEPGKDPKWEVELPVEVQTMAMNTERASCRVVASMYTGIPSEHEIKFWKRHGNANELQTAEDFTSFPELSIEKRTLELSLTGWSGGKVSRIYAWIQAGDTHETECYTVPLPFEVRSIKEEPGFLESLTTDLKELGDQ